MLPTDPLLPVDFRRLTARTSTQLEKEIARGHVIHWHQRPGAIGRAGRRPRSYLAIDAVLVVLSDQAVVHGPPRGGLSLALPAMQVCLGKAIDKVDGLIGVGVGNDGTTLAVVAGTEDDIAQTMARTGVFSPQQCQARWIWPTYPAVVLLRERAAKAEIELPETFALTANARPAWAEGAPAWTFDGSGVLSTWSPDGNARPALAPLPLIG